MHCAYYTFLFSEAVKNRPQQMAMKRIRLGYLPKNIH